MLKRGCPGPGVSNLQHRYQKWHGKSSVCGTWQIVAEQGGQQQIGKGAQEAAEQWIRLGAENSSTSDRDQSGTCGGCGLAPVALGCGRDAV